MLICNSFLLLLLLVTCSTQVNANEVIGCGGYVRSNTEINFKIIKVKLLTKDGIVKYTTESSPVNGYYMIPVYTKGEYILQVNPPPGWSFEPTQVNVNVDGKTDPCTKNEDINFFFKGFGLSGKIVTLGDSKNNGPSGITLDLISSNKVIDSTLSGADGSYYFSNVMPAAYEIEARHPSIKFQTNKVSVILSKENWSAKDNIVVSGYKIEGTVNAIDKSPVKDALIELYFSDSSFSKVNTDQFVCDSSSKSLDHLRVCHTRTDSNGKFKFDNIIFGKYKLVASLVKQEMSFGMQPQSLLVDLTQHKDVILTDSFRLHQVTITSRAFLSESGRPLVNGELYIDGINTGVKTSPDGSFVLPTATSGMHKFEIKSKNVYFQEKSVNIDLTSSSCLDENSVANQKLLSLTSFKAYSFDICGQIKMLKEQETYLNEITRSVQINVFKLADNKLYKTTSLNANLQYCIQLEANSEYVIRADLTSSLAQIIKLMPVEQKLKVNDSPIMNVNFEQMEAKLDIIITLLADVVPVPNDLKLTIRLDDPKRTWTRSDVLIQCNKINEKEEGGEGELRTRTLVKCKLSLTNLLFGKYLISTNYDDLFCWLKKDPINVNSEHQIYLLDQSGYLLNYELSHKQTLIKIVDNEQILFSKNILNDNDLNGRLCLSAAKDYKLLVESCYKYTTSDSDIDTFHIEPSVFKKTFNKLTLKALKTQVIIDVVFKFENKLEKQRVTSDDLFVQVKVDSSPTEIQLVKFKLKSETENQMIFTSKSWFVPQQLLHLHAKSNKILFENSLKDLKVNELNCEFNYAQFEAKLGIFLDVTVQPKDIDDISLILKSTVDDSILSKEQISGIKGYRVGPVKPPFSNYNIELSKSGYLFTKLPLLSGDASKNAVDTFRIDFNAEKLGQLKVNVINSLLKTNVENVLLSLSSENRLFRQTSKTDLNGQASFDNLKPGLYYLILMMQEYEFVPNSHPIQISDGYHMNLVVEANRVAYSCFGKVSSVNGQAENGITVQAIGVKSSSSSIENDQNEAENEACKSIQENSQIENADLGNYRIYNLKPNCEYMLTLRQNEQENNNNLFKIVPENYLVVVNNTDLIDKNFVVLNQIEKVDITLAVSFKSALTPIFNPKQLTNYVRVKLFKTTQSSTVLQTQFASSNSIVYFNSVPRDISQQYSIQVELLSASTVVLAGTIQQQQQLQQLPVIESFELSFYSDSTHKHLLADFDLDKKNFAFGFDFKQQQYQNFYFTLPLFILMIGLFLNSKRVQFYLQQIYSQIEQRGGFVQYFQSLTGTAKTVTATTTNQKSNKSKHRETANTSDIEKSTSSNRGKTGGGNRGSAVEDLTDTDFTDSDIQTVSRRKTKKAD